MLFSWLRVRCLCALGAPDWSLLALHWTDRLLLIDGPGWSLQRLDFFLHLDPVLQEGFVESERTHVEGHDGRGVRVLWPVWAYLCKGSVLGVARWDDGIGGVDKSFHLAAEGSEFSSQHSEDCGPIGDAEARTLCAEGLDGEFVESLSEEFQLSSEIYQNVVDL